MRRFQGAPGRAAGASFLPPQADDMRGDPVIAVVKELSIFARDFGAPQRVRRIVSRFVEEKPDLLFELSVSPGEVKDLDDCMLSFAASKIAGELLEAVRARDWDRVLAMGRRYLG
jgi:hypothetical protein